jgi:hypothetical protein
MAHLPPGFGLQDAPIGLGELLTTWLLVQLVILVVIGGLLMLFPPHARPATACGGRRRRAPRAVRTMRAHAARRQRPHPA